MEGAVIALERLLDGVDVAVEASDRSAAPMIRSMADGSCVLALAGGVSLHFSRSTVTIRPASRPASTRVVPRPRAVGGTPLDGTEAACLRGAIRVTYHGSVGLFEQLSEPLVADLAPDDPILTSVEELRAELAARRPGWQAMVESGVRRSLILLLRRCFEGTRSQPSWLGSVEDDRVRRALAAMRDAPGHAFTLAELAELAAMSRSVFAARFAAVCGRSPMAFLKTLRLRQAAQLLVQTDLPVKGVAAKVGYTSRSSFTRAFLAQHGTAPATFRARRKAVDRDAPGTEAGRGRGRMSTAAA
jgi:AraC-like DNA-binding protein